MRRVAPTRDPGTQAPEGICLTGVVNTICCLYLSDKFRASNEVVSDVLLALCESTKSRVTVVDDVGRLVQAYDLASAKGPRARPWTRVAAISADDADYAALQEMCGNRKSIVADFDSFATTRSKIDRDWCSGRWHIGAAPAVGNEVA